MRPPIHSVRSLVWALCLLSWVSPSVLSAQTPIDLFLKFTPTNNNAPAIVGDSDDETYPGSAGWFAIKAFSVGATNGTTVGGTTGGADAATSDRRFYRSISAL